MTSVASGALWATHSSCSSGVLRSQNLMIPNSCQLPWHTNTNTVGLLSSSTVLKMSPVRALGPSPKTDKEGQANTYEGNAYWSCNLPTSESTTIHFTIFMTHGMMGQNDCHFLLEAYNCKGSWIEKSLTHES